MQPALSIVAVAEDVRAFIQEYFDAWSGIDVPKIPRLLLR